MKIIEILVLYMYLKLKSGVYILTSSWVTAKAPVFHMGTQGFESSFLILASYLFRSWGTTGVLPGVWISYHACGRPRLSFQLPNLA